MAKKPVEKHGGGSGAGAVHDSSALEAELAYMLKRAGHDAPADRLAGMVAGYAELKGMLELLRQPRTAANEPANVYSLDTITRSA